MAVEARPWGRKEVQSVYTVSRVRAGLKGRKQPDLREQENPSRPGMFAKLRFLLAVCNSCFGSQDTLSSPTQVSLVQLH